VWQGGDDVKGEVGSHQDRDDQPLPAAAFAGARVTRGAQPQCLTHHRPAECALLPVEQDHDQDELPHQPDGQEGEQGAGEGAGAGETVSDQRCSDPG
jgi:hypothetical protein